MPSALSRDTKASASVISANSLSETPWALAPLVPAPLLAWFIGTSTSGSPRPSRQTVSRDDPGARHRRGHSTGLSPDDDDRPAWRPAACSRWRSGWGGAGRFVLRFVGGHSCRNSCPCHTTPIVYLD